MFLLFLLVIFLILLLLFLKRWLRLYRLKQKLVFENSEKPFRVKQADQSFESQKQPITMESVLGATFVSGIFFLL